MHKGAAAMHRHRSLAAKHASSQRGTHRNEASPSSVHQFRSQPAFQQPNHQGSAGRIARRSALSSGNFYPLARALQ
jgi:hypothetical protein